MEFLMLLVPLMVSVVPIIIVLVIVWRVLQAIESIADSLGIIAEEQRRH